MKQYRASPVPTQPDKLSEWLRREFQAVQAGIDGVLATAMRWRGFWAAGSYQAGDVVRDGSWLAVALRPTTQRPAPGATDPAWVLTPEPAWGGANTTSYFGFRVTGTTVPMAIDIIRFRAKQSGTFDLFLVKDGIRETLAEGLEATAGVWHSFYPGKILLQAGSIVDVVAYGGSYNEALNYFTNPNWYGFRSPTYPPMGNEVNKNAYGIDVSYSQGILSDDWDLLSSE